MDYITWTFFFRRLMRNPTYYGLEGVDETNLNKVVFLNILCLFHIIFQPNEGITWSYVMLGGFHIYDVRTGGGQKIPHPKFCGRHIRKPPYPFVWMKHDAKQMKNV